MICRKQAVEQRSEISTASTRQAHSQLSGLTPPFLQHGKWAFIVTPDRYDVWLDRGVTAAEQVMKLLQSVPEDALSFHRVSTRVSSAKNQGADLMEPINA
jgi:putative SOS response-associated peptidase YedK